MLCSVCGKAKRTIQLQHSAFVAEYRFFACSTCRTGRKEPRWLLLLVGRSLGFDVVADHIRDRMYEGVEISAAELL